MKSDNKRIIKWVILLVLVLPSIIAACYTYPAQDDFHYTLEGRRVMEEGRNLFSMAWYKTVDYYKIFCGCYTSSFLGYFFSGIIQCNVLGIRIYEVCSLIFFYTSIFFCVDALFVKAFKVKKEISFDVYLVLLFCINGLVYYIEHEDYYWFITSVQYLTIMSLIFWGITFYIYAIEKNTMVWIVLSSFLGFLGAGGALNIAFFCFAFYIFVGVFYFIKKKSLWKRLILEPVVVTIGVMINGVCPGNYLRSGGSKSISDIFEAITNAIYYTMNRTVFFLRNPLYWCAIVVLIMLAIYAYKMTSIHFSFACPFAFTFFMLAVVAFVIFPVMIGYGLETYQIICRSNFISDITIYIATIAVVFYWIGWWRVNNIQIPIPKKYVELCSVALCLIFFGIAVFQNPASLTFVRQMKEIAQGEYASYSDYAIQLYQKMAQAEGEEPVVTIVEVEDRTCMINPGVIFGYYDPEETFGNKVWSELYGKKNIYVLRENN